MERSRGSLLSMGSVLNWLQWTLTVTGRWCLGGSFSADPVAIWHQSQNGAQVGRGVLGQRVPSSPLAQSAHADERPSTPSASSQSPLYSSSLCLLYAPACSASLTSNHIPHLLPHPPHPPASLKCSCILSSPASHHSFCHFPSPPHPLHHLILPPQNICRLQGACNYPPATLNEDI